MGEGLVERIVSEREAAGPFKDFYDFCNRVDPVVLNKRTVESLIKAGAFDSLGHPRQGLCLVFEQVLDRTLARRREADQGVLSLFGGPGGGEQVFDDTRVPVPDQEFDKHQKLAFEKEMLGLYVSDHPLVGAEAALRRHTDCTILDLREEGPGGTSARWAARTASPRGRSGNGYGAGRNGDGGGTSRLVRRAQQRALGGRRGHRARPPVHQEGRAHGHVRPGGPAVVDRGLRLPSHHDRGGPPAGRRRRGLREGQARPPRRGPQARLLRAQAAPADLRRVRAAAGRRARQRPGRQPGRAPAGAAPGAPGAVAGLPACGHQSGPAGPGVQRDDEPRLAGGAAGTARTCLFVER